MISERDAVLAFVRELGYADSLVDALLGANLIKHIERDKAGVSGIAAVGYEGNAEVFWVRPDKRKTSLALRIFRIIEDLARKKGVLKLKIYARVEKARMYERRGYVAKFVILEKAL